MARVQGAGDRVQLALQAPLKRVQDFGDLLTPLIQFFDTSRVAERFAQQNASLQFPETAHRDSQKLNVFAASLSAISLGNVRRNRNRRSSHLRRQVISLVTGKCRAQVVDILYQRHRFLPGNQILKRFSWRQHSVHFVLDFNARVAVTAPCPLLTAR